VCQNNTKAYLFIGSFHSPHVTGLVDASTSEEFDKMLSKLQFIWQKRELEFSSRSPLCINGLLSIMQKIRCFMIVPVRERVGLGKPPLHFTTNANESINNVKFCWKNWNKFCDEMFSLVKIQYQELEKAVIHTGEYHFQTNFKKT